MTSLDTQIGENLARLRTPRMSQRDFAQEMSLRGWKWSHATVGAVERGDRPLRAAEAIGAAEVLEVDLMDIVTAKDSAEMRRAQSAVLIAHDRLQTAVSAWDAARLELAVVADTIGYTPPQSEIPGVQVLDAMPLIDLTAREVVTMVRERPWWKESASDYLASKGDGAWVRRFVQAEEREIGQHQAEA